MEMKANKLKGGESYSIRELFSGDNDKVVIPDLQRDYCWANESNNLVGPFLDTLIHLDKSEDLTMGLVYGYFDPLLPNHLQLCDGQQRLTTLFLIIGSLNRRLNNRYRDILISDYELHQDDCEPYLQYAIRESSLYFISDLVLHYFIRFNEEDTKLVDSDSIRKSYWFLHSYNNDPTIRCAISAIKTIESKIKDMDETELRTLGDFITGINNETPQIKFLYYDMDNRTNGEETFVVINTTGEPLSANQNLKPLVINLYKNHMPDIENKWEEMETWFWRNRDKSEEKTPHTSDEGMSEFFRCVRLYNAADSSEFISIVDSKDSFPYADIPFDRVYSLFKLYSKVYSIDYSARHDAPICYNNRNNRGRYTAEQLYALLPTIRYCEHFPDATDEEIRRFYHVFLITAGYQDVSNRKEKDGRMDAPAKRIMQIVDDMTSKDVLCLKNSDKLSEHEQMKLRMIDANINDRANVEKYLSDAEQNPIFNGRLKVILDWCNNLFSEFEKYYRKICSLWEGNCGSNIDTLRRALLTVVWNEYPIVVERKSHKTLGWEWNEWYSFFTRNSEKVKDFLDSELSIKERIENYSDTCNPYYPIIKDGKYLAASNVKNVYTNDTNIVVLMEKERTQANYCIFFNSIDYQKKFLGGRWNTPWYWKGLLYCNHSHYDLTIDYIYEPERGYRILIWKGKHKQQIPFNRLFEVQQFGLFKVDKGTEGWCSHDIVDGEEAKALFQKIANWVDSI